MKKILFFILFTNVLFADVTTIISGEEISGSIEKSEIIHYKISASAGKTVEILLNGLDNDADLRVRIGAKAKGGTYNCKSTNDGINPDSCSVTLTENNDVYIRINGFRATNYTLKARIINSENKADAIALTSAQSLSSSIERGEINHYKISALAGNTVNIQLDGLSDDADLHVRIGALAKGGTYDCKSTNMGTTADTCSVTLTSDADVFIRIYGYRATNYTLTASLSAGESIVNIVSGETISASVSRDEIKYYKINTHFGDKVIATISALTADADIYIKKGEKPTASSFDCKSTNGGTDADSCSIDILQDTEVYIGVAGFRTANYNLLVTSEREMIPANPQIPTVLEDAEGGTLNPNWVTVRGDKPAYIWPTPDIPGAPDGDGVIVMHANGAGASLYRYELPVNNTSQMILSMDCGGLPNHKFENYPEDRRGFIPHNGVGVVVKTKLGQRIMNWDSWYTHQGYGPRINDNGHNVFLNYPAPVEMVRGWYAPIDRWEHFEVNLNTELQRLEPDNEIIRIVQFFTTGGYLDNITLSAAN